jgi:hypothetical protein
MSFPRDLWISMRSADAVRFFERVAEDARQADGRDGAFEVVVDAEPNASGPTITVHFNNDDMERDEMSGRTIVDWDA